MDTQQIIALIYIILAVLTLIWGYYKCEPNENYVKIHTEKGKEWQKKK